MSLLELIKTKYDFKTNNPIAFDKTVEKMSYYSHRLPLFLSLWHFFNILESKSALERALYLNKNQII